MDFKKYPKVEDVDRIEFGGGREVSVIKLTDENRQYALELALSMYLGEQCQFCLRTFDTLDDLKGSVWAPWEHGRIAHQKCWDNRPADKYPNVTL